jgi:hypothetical protein
MGLAFFEDAWPEGAGAGMIYVAIVIACAALVAWRSPVTYAVKPYLLVAAYSAVPVVAAVAGFGLGALKSGRALDITSLVAMLACCPAVYNVSAKAVLKDLTWRDHAFAGSLVTAIAVNVVAGMSIVGLE